MALIAMAVYDTEVNQRSWMTRDTIISLFNTVDFGKHRLIVVDNNSCAETQSFYEKWGIRGTSRFRLIQLPENIGTARAINKAWKERLEHENAIKMDNDVVIYQSGWVDQMEEAIARDPTIGIIGLKRKDCIETPWNSVEWYRSKLKMLPHIGGQRWIIVEEANHIMGTCQMYSSKLLEKIGYLYQLGGLYGFDDALASVRAHVAGFSTVFLPHIDIDHIDPGTTEYQQWKESYAGERMDAFNRMKRHIIESGSVYIGPDE